MTRPLALAATAAALFFTVQCGSSSTSSPTATSGGVVSVTLASASLPAGQTAQGTVTLAAVAPAGGTGVALSSSNAAVATVPVTLAIPAGSASATFLITTVAPGTATFTASTATSSSQSAALTVTNRITLAAITLTSSTVTGGDSVFGTASLTGPAPAGGAVVTLTGTDPLTLPPSVTVLAGATSATFSALTRTVGGTITSTITGSYGGASMSATVSVLPPSIATASFGITGATESDTCSLSNAGNTLNCTFNGSTSTAPGTIVAWDWTYGSKTMFSQTTTGPVLTLPTVNCSIIPAPPLPAPPADQWFPLTVTLKVHDSLGNVSAVKTNSGARLFPAGSCGF